jgi:hypothetical protein
MLTSSPFPGMDPYLEAHWRDVHTKLVAYTADAMNRILPEDLAAESEEHVSVASDDGTERSVRIIESGTQRLITVIEFISPSNKRTQTADTGDGWTIAFRRNRRWMERMRRGWRRC